MISAVTYNFLEEDTPSVYVFFSQNVSRENQGLHAVVIPHILTQSPAECTLAARKNAAAACSDGLKMSMEYSSRHNSKNIFAMTCISVVA